MEARAGVARLIRARSARAGRVYVAQGGLGTGRSGFRNGKRCSEAPKDRFDTGFGGQCRWQA